MFIFVEDWILLPSHHSKQSFGQGADHPLALLLLVLSLFLNVVVHPFQHNNALELVGVFGDVVTAEFDGLAFGIFNGGFLFHDPLGDLDDLVHKFDIVLDVVLLDVETVDDRGESLVEVVERLVVELAVDGVHLGYLKVYNLDEVEHVRDTGEDLLLACLQLLFLYLDIGFG